MSSGPIWYSGGRDAEGDGNGAGAGAAGGGATGAALAAAGGAAAARSRAGPASDVTFATPSNPSGLRVVPAEKISMSPTSTVSGTPTIDGQLLASRTIRVLISDVRLARPSGRAASM